MFCFVSVQNTFPTDVRTGVFDNAMSMLSGHEIHVDNNTILS